MKCDKCGINIYAMTPHFVNVFCECCHEKYMEFQEFNRQTREEMHERDIQVEKLSRENKKLKDIIQGLEYQKKMDGLKVNYQWGKFIYYVEKFEELLLEMKSKISDEEEENEYQLFIKERHNAL